MGSVTRESVLTFGDGTTVKLKKWSTAKFFLALRLLGEIGKDVADKISIKAVKETDPQTGAVSDRMVVDWNARELLSLFLNVSDHVQGKVTRIIRESCCDDNVTEETILSWDPEDYLAVLARILEMNLAEQLGKNFLGLRDTFLKQIRRKG